MVKKTPAKKSAKKTTRKPTNPDGITRTIPSELQKLTNDLGRAKQRNIKGDDPLVAMDEDLDDAEAERIKRKKTLADADQTPLQNTIARDSAYKGGKLREKVMLKRRRIKECQALLALSVPSGEIARTIAERWGRSESYCRKIVAIARRRNLEALNRNPTETKADSIHFWSTRLQNAEGRRQRGYADMDKGWEIVNELKARVKRATPEELNVLTKMLDKAEALVDHGRKTVAGAEYHADCIQDRLDKLLGNYAPERIALTTADGQDVLKPAAEPITEHQARSRLLTIMQRMAATFTPEERSSLAEMIGIRETVPVGKLIEVQAKSSIPIRIVEEHDEPRHAGD